MLLEMKIFDWPLSDINAGYFGKWLVFASRHIFDDAAIPILPGDDL